MNKVNFFPKSLCYHGTTNERELSMKVCILSSMVMSSYTPYLEELDTIFLSIAEFLELFMDARPLELIGIIFKIVHACHVVYHIGFMDFDNAVHLLNDHYSRANLSTLINCNCFSLVLDHAMLFLSFESRNHYVC